MSAATRPASRYFVPLVPVLISGTIYAGTLAPTVTAEDSGELIAAAYHFGIPHPPGYPLWTLLCGVFIRLIPIGEIAYRANLFSACCAALSTLPLFLALTSLGMRRTVAVAGALTWALSGTLWSQSVITEVYGLNALTCSLLLWAFVQWHVTQNGRWLIAASLFFGLGMSNHHTIAFVAVALGLWALGLQPRLLRQWKLVFLCIVVFAAGLLPYAYLPIRAGANPRMNWGDPSTAERLWNHVSRSQYGATAPLKVEAGRSLSRFGRQLAYVSGLVARDLTWPVAVGGLLGLGILYRRNRPVLTLVLLLLLSCGVLFLLISNINLDRMFRFAMRVFFIPISLALIVPLAFFLEHVARWIERRAGATSKLLVFALAAAAVLSPGVQNFSRCNYSNYWYAYDHATNQLAGMLPNALFFSSGDHDTFPLTYLTLVEGVRSDVTIAAIYGYVDPALLREFPDDGDTSFTSTSEQEKTQWLILRSRRPVYYTRKTAPPARNASFVPVGLAYHLLPENRTIDRESCWRKIAYRNIERPSAADIGSDYILADYYFFQALNDLRRGDRDAALRHFEQSAKHGRGIKECFNNIGSALGENGLPAEALAYFEEARALDPRYTTARWNLVRVCRQLGRWDRMEEMLGELAALAPDDYRVYREWGFLVQDVRNDRRRARRMWLKSLELNPDQPDLRQTVTAMPSPDP